MHQLILLIYLYLMWRELLMMKDDKRTIMEWHLYKVLKSIEQNSQFQIHNIALYLDVVSDLAA